jgi:hypothetical protein
MPARRGRGRGYASTQMEGRRLTQTVQERMEGRRLTQIVQERGK